MTVIRTPWKVTETDETSDERGDSRETKSVCSRRREAKT